MIGELLGYVCDGAIYCPDCRPAGDDATVGEIIDQGGSDLTGGETCDACRACYLPMNVHGWHAWQPTDPANLQMFRWACCTACNAQKPFLREDSAARLQARRGELTCTWCAQASLQF